MPSLAKTPCRSQFISSYPKQAHTGRRRQSKFQPLAAFSPDLIIYIHLNRFLKLTAKATTPPLTTIVRAEVTMMSCIRIRPRLVRIGHKHWVCVYISRRHNKYPREFTGHADPNVGRSIRTLPISSSLLSLIAISSRRCEFGLPGLTFWCRSHVGGTSRRAISRARWGRLANRAHQLR